MVRAELQEARLKLYEKKDRTRATLIVGVAVFAVFAAIGVLNMLDSLDISFRAKQLIDTNANGTFDVGDTNIGCDYKISADDRTYAPFDTTGLTLTELQAEFIGHGLPRTGGMPDAGECPIRRGLNFFIIATLGMIGPIGFYMASRQRNIKQIERRLPEFLRDVAEAGRFGMTLAEAIVVASSGRYGKLTPEIRKMAAQIEWGVTATEALRLFAERVKTPQVARIVSIIVKSSDAGGDVADVLTMVSLDARESQLTEDERRISMGTYIMVIYISFIVFIVTIWILNVTFLPKIKEASSSLAQKASEGGASASVESPLAANIDQVISDLQLAFFVAMVVHAVGDGILAGVLDNGKIANGLRHSFLMLVITLVSVQLV